MAHKNVEFKIVKENSSCYKHLLNVHHKGILLLQKSGKDAKQVTSKIWSLKKFVIQGVSFKCGRTIEHHSHFRLLRVIDPMIGRVPGSSNFIFELTIHLVSMSFGEDVRHETAVIRKISLIGLQTFF